MFKINDYVIYKSDVCLINDIKKIHDLDYYVITPINDSSLKINLPIDSKFIRAIISYEDAIKIIDNIPNVQVVDASNDKALEQIYKKLLMSDDLNDLVVVVKTTYLRNKNRLDKGKKNGSVDTFYYEEGIKKLFSELSITLKLDEDKIESIFFEQMNK